MLFLARNGTSTLDDVESLDGHIGGWLTNSLNIDGKGQSKSIAEFLDLVNIKKLYASPMIRARETAEIISWKFNLHPVVLDGLSPWNTGMLSGKPWAGVHEQIHHYFNNPLDFVRDGESYSEFYNRWKKELFNLIEESKTQNICAITHSSNLACLNHILYRKKIVLTESLDPGKIIQLNPEKLSFTVI